MSSATPSLPPGGHRRPTMPAFASAPALSWVLLLAACDHASAPSELACRRPRYGYTRDGARSARRSVLRPRVVWAALRLSHPNSWEILYADCQLQASLVFIRLAHDRPFVRVVLFLFVLFVFISISGPD